LGCFYKPKKNGGAPLNVAIRSKSFNHYNSGYKVKVADTVGAGDSFLGSFISQLVKSCQPSRSY
tara:strand:- start:44067 stop:44258 length:192 start_codon:yes stop_codon:yes gene_type:complete